MLICAHKLRTSCGGLSEDGTRYVKGAPQLSVPPGAFGGTGPGMRGMRGKRGKRGARGIVAQVEGVIGFLHSIYQFSPSGTPRGTLFGIVETTSWGHAAQIQPQNEQAGLRGPKMQ